MTQASGVASDPRCFRVGTGGLTPPRSPENQAHTVVRDS